MSDKGLLVKTSQGISPNKVINNCCVLCRDETIYAIGGKSAFKNAEYTNILDIPDSYVVPGFIDSHIYGFQGYSFTDGVGALSKISKALVEHGVTTFLPTIKARNLDKELTSLHYLSKEESKSSTYAEPVGIHLVGPFISSSFKGDMQDDGVRKKVDMQELQQIVEASDGMMKVMTFAPEIQGHNELIQFLLDNNIIPSMGYSAADEKEVYEAIKSGCFRTTHLYNAMAPLHQRNLGLSSTSLIDKRVYIELIIDGLHIAPQMINLACQVKKNENVIAVSAATKIAMLPEGDYMIDNQEVSIINNLCVLKNGKISGSTFGLDEGWKNILKFTNYQHFSNEDSSFEDAFSPSNLQLMSKNICYFTANPARDLKLDDRGHLSPGLLADLVIFNKKHQVEATVKAGKVVYVRNPQYLKSQ